MKPFSSEFTTCIKNDNITKFIQLLEEVKDINYMITCKYDMTITETLLSTCCRYGNFKFIDILLTQQNIDLNLTDEYKITPLLILACRTTDFFGERYGLFSAEEKQKLIFIAIEKLCNKGAKLIKNYRDVTALDVINKACSNENENKWLHKIRDLLLKIQPSE